jgi:hypothetical protein
MENISKPGLFSQTGEAALPLNMGKSNMVFLYKGKKELDVNSFLGENCMILKNFSLGTLPSRPAKEGKKALKT